MPNSALEDGKIEIHQLFELMDFGPSDAIERFRDLASGEKLRT